MESFKVRYIAACKEKNLLPSDNVLHVLRESTKLSQKADGGLLILQFSGCNLSVNDCQVLSRCFATDQAIEGYHFTDCLLSEDACKVLLNSFTFNKTIAVLDLKGNNIRSSGAQLIGKLLKRTTSLRELYLEWNTLGMWDEGINAIAEGLSLNQSLQVLDLSNNQISHEGGQELAAGLKRNKVLKTLDMRWNNIGVLGGRAFLSSLSHNKYIVNLLLAGNNIPSDTLKAITTAVQRNIDYHSIFEEHQSMARSLKQEIDHLQLEKSMQVNTLVNQLEKEKSLHDNLTETTRDRLDQMKAAIEELKKESKHLRQQNENFQIEITEKNSKLKELECKSEELHKDRAKVVKDMREQYSIEVDKLSESLRKERQLKVQEQTEKEQLSVDLMKKISEWKQKFEEQTNETNLYQNSLKKARLEHDNETTNLLEKYTHEVNELKTRLKKQETDLSEKVTRFDKEKHNYEEEIAQLKSSALNTKLKHEENVITLRSQWKQEDMNKSKQYEERIDMLVTTKDELQSKISKLSIQVAELNTQLLSAQKETETFKRQSEHHQQLAKQKEIEYRNEISQYRSDLDSEKRKAIERQEKIQKLENTNQEMKSQLRELQISKDTEIASLKDTIRARDDEIKRIRDDEMRRAGLLENALQSYIASTRSSHK